MILFLVCVALAYLMGVLFAVHGQIKYKRRWREAVAVIEQMSDESKLVAERDAAMRERDQLQKLLTKSCPTTLAKQVTVDDLRGGSLQAINERGYHSAPSPQAIKELVKKPPTTRCEAERARLHASMPPIDPLTGLPPSVYLLMVKTRFRHGYDESGQIKK